MWKARELNINKTREEVVPRAKAITVETTKSYRTRALLEA
jgi:hypothetical protein